MKFCPRCGAKNGSGDAVCGSCGQKLYGLLAGTASQLACAFCATGNPPTAVYCLGCGRRLDETPTSVRAARRKAAADALAGVPPPTAAAATSRPPARTAAAAAQSTRHTIGCAAAVAVLVAAAGTAFVFRATIRPGGTPAPIEQDAAIATVAALIDRATPRSAFSGSAGGGSRSTGPQRETEPPAASGSADRASPRAATRPTGDASTPPSGDARAAGSGTARTDEATTDRPSATGASDDAEAGRPGGVATGSGTSTGARVDGTAATSVSTPSGQSDTARAADASGADRAAAGDGRTDAGGQASRATGSPVTAPADSPTAATGTAAATRSPIVSAGTARATPAGTPVATAVVAARSGSIIFTLTRIAVDPVTPVPGHHVLVLTAVIENAGAGLLPYDRGDFRLADGLGANYQPLPPAVGGLAAGLIQPGRQISGDVVFDVPAGRRDLTLLYEGIVLDLSSRLPPT